MTPKALIMRTVLAIFACKQMSEKQEQEFSQITLPTSKSPGISPKSCCFINKFWYVSVLNISWRVFHLSVIKVKICPVIAASEKNKAGHAKRRFHYRVCGVCPLWTVCKDHFTHVIPSLPRHCAVMYLLFPPVVCLLMTIARCFWDHLTFTAWQHPVFTNTTLVATPAGQWCVCVCGGGLWQAWRLWTAATTEKAIWLHPTYMLSQPVLTLFYIRMIFPLVISNVLKLCCHIPFISHMGTQAMAEDTIHYDNGHCFCFLCAYAICAQISGFLSLFNFNMILRKHKKKIQENETLT